jgi:copper chaperone NosL
MAYQPPLIGFKQLLNFGAYSIPDIGGWIFLGVGALMLVGLFLEWRSTVKQVKFAATTLLLPLVLLLSSCTTKPEPFILGQDACHFCKMTISQPNFGAEWITSKGRLYKFDDIHCLNGYLKAKDQNEQGDAWLASYLQPPTFHLAKDAWILESDQIRGPMGGHYAAFQTEAELKTVQEKLGGKALRWAEIKP